MKSNRKATVLLVGWALTFIITACGKKEESSLQSPKESIHVRKTSRELELQTPDHSKKLLTTVDLPKLVWASFKVSPDNLRIAYIEGSTQTDYVIPEGQPQLQAYQDLKHTLVLDGKKVAKYAEIKIHSIRFSHDSRRIGFLARKLDKWFAVIEGREYGPHENVDDLTFNPKDNRFAYMCAESGKVWVMSDGKAGTEYEGVLVGSLRYSPDGEHLAYVAKRGNVYCVVLDGKELLEYKHIADELVFSRDGRRLAYFAKKDENWFVVIDGKEYKGYNGIGEGTFRFNPDGTRFCYAAFRSGKAIVVADGEEQAAYDQIVPKSLMFSPNSQKMAYGAVESEKRFVVVNGIRGKEYDGIGEGSVTFSPNSECVAYVAEAANARFVVVNEKEGTRYLDVGIPVFSPDSRHIAYPAQLDKGFCVVIDSAGREKFDGILTIGGGNIVFDSSDKVHYLAADGKNVYLVEEYLK